MHRFGSRAPRIARGFFSAAAVLSVVATIGAQGRPPYLPDPRLTPGDALDVTKDDLCEHARSSQGISISLKRQIFDRYGIGPDSPGSFDVEHLIPQSLGGSNSIKNLWPQPMTGEWNHAMKDKLEHRLHRMVCKGTIDLKTAQQEIASDWVRAFKKYIGDPNQRPKQN